MSNNLYKKERPSWEEIIDIMHDRGLNYVEGYEIVDVIYSLDKAHRYVILKVDENYLTYKYEYLAYDEEEYDWVPVGEIPAYWIEGDTEQKSIFDNLKELMRELKAEPQYKAYFDIH